MKKKLRKLSRLGLMVAFLSVPAFAYAQDEGAAKTSGLDDACYSLDQNDKWSVLFSEFAEAYSLQDYKTALDKTASLKAICVRSPILNFSIAQTYYQLGDKKTALNYIKDATHYTQEFNVSDEVAKRMWELRYQLENGDVIAEKDAEIARLKSDVENGNLRVNELNAELEKERVKSRSTAGVPRDNAKKVWMTGAAVGGVGIVSLAVGAGLLAGIYTGDKSIKGVSIENSKGENSYSITPGAQVAWTFFGLGLGMTVAGAIMAGIGGYQYTHSVNEDVVLSWGVSPNSIDFSMQF